MKQRKIPMRMCVGCREMKPKRELLRVVKGTEGDISFDLTGRKPGRGAYVCRSADCLSLAIKKRQLERAFSAPISEEVREGLMREIGTLPPVPEESADGE